MFHGETLMHSADDKRIKTAGSFQSVMASRVDSAPLCIPESY